MKATVILKPLEYNIETVGEKWRQGEKVKGILRVKNNGIENIELPMLKISLSSGNYKKVKAKDKKAWESLDSSILAEKILLNAGEEKNYSWEFQLAEDCRISDKDGSAYLRFLNEEDEIPAGNIELLVEPKQVMIQFLEIFDNFLRFKIGPKKYSKGMVEVKLTPPNSRELSSVEGLVLRMCEVEGQLNLEYTFNTRVLEMIGTTMSTEKKVKQFKQILNQKQYYVFGAYEQEFILNSLNSIVDQVKPKLML
jgi:hypothetical protein